jgi:membrane fusion protein (multidrug efflux system)
VLAAKAALETAALNLGYTKVTAPISGRIGKALITEGALASASEATKMAVIRQLDPIYVDFTQSSAEMLKLRRSLESGKMQGVSKKRSRSRCCWKTARPTPRRAGWFSQDFRG